MADQDSRGRILEAAERRARTGGYYGFSFRDVAEDVGVKSSSVHYHFPTKADLGQALAEHYTARVKQRLGDPAAVSPSEALARVTAVFRDALLVEDKMCLCGLFGAERDALPPPVESAVGGFFEMILGYLTTAFGKAWKGPNAHAVLACLEGALIMARVLGEARHFDQATAWLGAARATKR